MTLSPATTEKALRLHTTGKVHEVMAARVFTVQGDHGEHTVVLANETITCTCKATGVCSHIAAAGLALKA
jgi:hypothetical protein